MSFTSLSVRLVVYSMLAKLNLRYIFVWMVTSLILNITILIDQWWHISMQLGIRLMTFQSESLNSCGEMMLPIVKWGRAGRFTLSNQWLRVAWASIVEQPPTGRSSVLRRCTRIYHQSAPEFLQRFFGFFGGIRGWKAGDWWDHRPGLPPTRSLHWSANWEAYK